MSTRRGSNGRDRELTSNGTHLPSFRDLVSFQPDHAPTRPMERSTSSRDRREDRIAETPSQRHPEETFEIVSIKRAASQASYREVADPHLRKDYEHGHHEWAQRRGESLRPDQDRRSTGQGNNDRSSSRFLQPGDDHQQQHLLHAEGGNHGNGQAHPAHRAYKPETNSASASKREDPPREAIPASRQMVQSSREYHVLEGAHSIGPPMSAMEASRPPRHVQRSYEPEPYLPSHSASGRHSFRATDHSRDARYDTSQSRQDDRGDLRLRQSAQPPAQARPPPGRHYDVRGSSKVHHDAYIYSQERRPEVKSAQHAHASQASTFVAPHDKAAALRQPSQHPNGERPFEYSGARLPMETHRPSSFSNTARPLASPRSEQRAMPPPQAGDRPKEPQHRPGRAGIGLHPSHSARATLISPHRSRPEDSYRNQSAQAGARDSSQASRPHIFNGNGAPRLSERPPQRIAAVDDAPVLRYHHTDRAMSPGYGDHPRYPSAPNGRHASATINKVKVDRDRDLGILRSSERQHRPPLHPPQSHRSDTVAPPSAHSRTNGRHELAYHFEMQQRQMEEERLRALRSTESVKTPQTPRPQEHSVRASYPQERIQSSHNQTPTPSPMLRDMRSHDRGKGRQDDQIRIVAEPNTYSWADRNRRSDYPPLPPLTSARGPVHRPFEQQTPSKSTYRADSSVGYQVRGSGDATPRTVGQGPQPIEAPRLSVDARHRLRVADRRNAPQEGPHPPDQQKRPPPTAEQPNRLHNHHDPQAPVVESQHTHPRPPVDQPQSSMPAPPRPLKRQRAGSDTSLVLKSTRLALVEAETDPHRPTSSLALPHRPCSEK